MIQNVAVLWAGVKGTETVITISCSGFVLVNQATKDLSPTHASEVRERRARIQQRVRRSAAEAAVGPARFEVGDVAENMLELTPTENERLSPGMPA